MYINMEITAKLILGFPGPKFKDLVLVFSGN